MRESTLRKLLGHESFPILLELHRADTLASTGDLSNCEFVQSTLSRYAEEPILPPPLVRGDDLLAMGVKEGPAIGQILEKVRDAQLEGLLGSRGDALALARDMAKNRA